MADERYCFAIDPRYGDVEAAPLMCAGLTGHRILRMAGDAQCLGICGVGAAAHIVAQVAPSKPPGFCLHSPRRCGGAGFCVFARRRVGGRFDAAANRAARWALVFAPVGSLVPAALAATRKDGTVVCDGIRMTDIPSFPYRVLWEERVLRSVANLTRRDAKEFLALAAEAGIRTETVTYPLEQANEALGDLRSGTLQGAVVLAPKLSVPTPRPTRNRGKFPAPTKSTESKL